MRIGIDLDDTMIETSKKILWFLEEYKNDIAGYDDIMANIVEIVRGVITTENEKKFLVQYAKREGFNVELKKDLIKVLKRLKTKGHQIIIITSRGDKQFDGNRAFTENYLKEKNVIYDEIYYDCHNKLQSCIDNKIDIMIDDSIKNTEEIKNYGIATILFNSIINKDMKTTIPRVNSWLELEIYIDNI